MRQFRTVERGRGRVNRAIGFVRIVAISITLLENSAGSVGRQIRTHLVLVDKLPLASQAIGRVLDAMTSSLPETVLADVAVLPIRIQLEVRRQWHKARGAHHHIEVAPLPVGLQIYLSLCVVPFLHNPQAHHCETMR